MQIILKFPQNITLTISSQPSPLTSPFPDSPRYRVQVKGIPQSISPELFESTAKATFKRKGFTAISSKMTHSTLSKWNASIAFYDPFHKIKPTKSHPKTAIKTIA